MPIHGESSSGSASGSVVSCRHNFACAINTSSTEKNPGRRFYCCRYWKDKSVDCGFFQWVDSGNSRGEDCFAELTYANASLKIKVEELETSLVTAKAKAARRKREYHDMHERAARLADDCVGLVAEIRNIPSYFYMDFYCMNTLLLLIVTYELVFLTFDIVPFFNPM
ncbi:hypothetical protein LINPERPRIM_LOCUS6316 [Linum perenne]